MAYVDSLLPSEDLLAVEDKKSVIFDVSNLPRYHFAR